MEDVVDGGGAGSASLLHGVHPNSRTQASANASAFLPFRTEEMNTLAGKKEKEAWEGEQATEPRHVGHRATKDAGKRAGLDKERKVKRMGKGRSGEGRREAKELKVGKTPRFSSAQRQEPAEEAARFVCFVMPVNALLPCPVALAVLSVQPLTCELTFSASPQFLAFSALQFFDTYAVWSEQRPWLVKT